jgi:hypothetical protein
MAPARRADHEPPPVYSKFDPNLTNLHGKPIKATPLPFIIEKRIAFFHKKEKRIAI